MIYVYVNQRPYIPNWTLKMISYWLSQGHWKRIRNKEMFVFFVDQLEFQL